MTHTDNCTHARVRDACKTDIHVYIYYNFIHILLKFHHSISSSLSDCLENLKTFWLILYCFWTIVLPDYPCTFIKNIMLHFRHFALTLFLFVQLFMSPHFSLENPDLFNTVFPWTQIEGAKSSQPGARQSSKLLQEKVSSAPFRWQMFAAKK